MRNLYRVAFFLLISIGAMAQPAPTATIISTTPVFCTGTPITFSAICSQSAATYTWGVSTIKGLVYYTSLNTNTVSFTFTNNLTYTVTVDVSSPTGTTSTNMLVPVLRRPKAAFNASLNTSGYPNQLILTNYSTNQVGNYWIFNDVSATDSSVSTVKNYAIWGNYKVSLVAKGLKGCNDTSRYAFDIPQSSSITLPNIFTPNNDDVNDVYRPIVVGINQLKARIYNRYGIILISWDKVNGFWDGYTTSGEPCSAGHYFIVVEALGFDGQVYKLKSGITLER